jgi:hypothetical protein
MPALAGEVESVGAGVTGFKPGDQVFGIDSTGLGAYAEYVCRREQGPLAHKPTNLTFEEAAPSPSAPAPHSTSSQVEMLRGDATDPADAWRACAGASHVYNCTNPVDYLRWPEQFPPLQRGVLEGAAGVGAKLILMENLYVYGPHGSAPKTAQLFANLDVSHTVSYIGDVGRALVTVGADDRSLGRAWHVPNAPAVSLRAFARILGEEARVEPKLSALPRLATRALLPLLSLSTPQLRGLEENLYIGYERYVVDHSAYARLFGDHATPLREAVRATVQWYRTRAAAAQPTAA